MSKTLCHGTMEIIFKGQIKMRIVAVIPIKLQNERLPGKNTKPLGGIPLIQYALSTMLNVSEIEDIYVFCSDIQISEYIPDGIKLLIRPKELDLPSSNFTQIFSVFSELVPADIYVYMHATAPFISVRSVKECIDAVVCGKHDSAFTATKIQDFLWTDGKPLNFDPANIPRSQDIMPIYRESSGVYVFRKEVFLQYKRRIGISPFICEVGYREAVDINTSEDFELAEKLL